MKQKLQNSLLIAFLMVIVLSCSKDDEKPSKTDLLIAKKWTVIKFEFEGADVTSDYISDCDADDYDKFAKDGTFIESVGTLKCDTETDDSGTWQWKEKETIFSIHYSNDDPYDWKLLELTATSFKISRYDANDAGTLTLTFIGK
jgi:hypothetical protein